MRTEISEIKETVMTTEVRQSLPVVVDWTDVADVQRTASEDCQDCD